MELQVDRGAGALTQGSVRYVALRPDVLMGIGRALGATSAFVDAMKTSAFTNARASFEGYRRQGLFDGADPLETTCELAAGLGWGRWRVGPTAGDLVTLEVANSPFAAGVESVDAPVCGFIAGVLQALFLIAYEREVEVVETACAAMGHRVCSFEIRPLQRGRTA